LILKNLPFITALASIAWVNTFTLAGFFLGRRYPQLKDYLEYIVLGLIVVTSLPLIAAFLKRKMHSGANV